MPIQTSDNKWSEYKWIVNKTAGLGTHTTIQAAIDAASAGDAIWVYPSTTAYEENLTISKKLSIQTSGPEITTIKGKITPSAQIDFHQFKFETNGDYWLSNSSSSTDLTFYNCQVNSLDNDGILNSAGFLALNNCSYIVSTTYKAFDISGGQLYYLLCTENTQGAAQPSTISGGTIIYDRCTSYNAITSSGTGVLTLNRSVFNPGNVTFTLGGSGAHGINMCRFINGTASCLTINNTTTVQHSIFTSSNTNAITGSGTLQYDSLSFTSSKTINTSTVTPLYDRLAYTIAPNLGIGVDPGTTAGITFDATNYLTVYSKAAWTPTLYGATSAGTTTYSFQSGAYERIGRLVFVTGQVTWTAATGTGSLRIGGLPYTINTANSVNPLNLNFTLQGNITAASGSYFVFQGAFNTDYVTLNTYTLSTGTQNATDLTANTNNSIRFSGIYLAFN